MSDQSNASQGTAAPGAQSLPAHASVIQSGVPLQQGQQAPSAGQEGAQQPAQGQPTAPAETAPVALPVEPEAPKPANPDTSTEFAYEATGDAGLDYALNFIGKHGYGDAHPAVMAAQKGDFTLIEAELATKGVAGADAVVALAKQAFARHAEVAQKQEAELAGFAAQAAGGAENWGVVRAWAAQEATPQEKAQVNAALAQGGLVAQGVITQLVNLYTQRHTLPKDAAAVASPNATPQAGGSAEPMTAQRYAQAVEALRQKMGTKAEDSAEYAALQHQRLAARRAGY